MSKIQNTDNLASPVEALFGVGAHFGFIKSRRHPTATPFIFGIKNKVDIFDLEKTTESLDKALDFVKTLGSKNGLILFVGGKNEAKDALANIAGSISQPYVAGRFIGGTLTNFSEIRKRVEKLEMLVSQKEKGELVKYTKKERLLIDRDITKLREFFFGLSVMKNLPPVENIPVNSEVSSTPETNQTASSTTIKIDQKKIYMITLETNYGKIVFETYTKDAPNTVANFLTLAEKGFYASTTFHRVIKGFMIQGGDPKGDGTGGPGYTFADELNPETASYKAGYKKGVVAMANAGPNTNGSQFFIMTADYPLPNNYSIFGKVVSGQDVVDKIASVKTGANDRPISPVIIKKASFK